ncbi:MAG: hypothetical protein RML72_01950 [Bacteroidia bacterium]|nr:hypothetical protein [Bacteroidia bacterium]MDW8157624.1 hypothetical protein [Bacteroidia bacterium]
MARKPKKNEKPSVNPQLEGFEIRINEFGEIISTIDIRKINKFLDENVDDKKFRGIQVVKRDAEEENELDTKK